MEAVEKAQRAWLFLKFLVRVSSGNSDRVKNLQEKRGFTKKRITRVHILDIGKHYDIQVVDGKMGVALFGRPAVHVYIRELCTLKHLRLGFKMGTDPATGQRKRMQYTLLNAWSSGDVSNQGEASTNDLFAFLDIFMELISMVGEEDVAKLIGPCEHDSPANRGSDQMQRASDIRKHRIMT